MEQLQADENLFNALEDQVRQACADRWNRNDKDLQPALQEFLQRDSKVFSRPLNQLTFSQIDGNEQSAVAAADQISTLMEKARELGRLFDVELATLTLNKCRALASLAELSQGGSLPESHWINPSVQGALDESARVLGQLSTIVRERQTAMESLYSPDILLLDINGLKVRFETQHRGLKAWSKQARLDKKTLRAVTVAGVVNKDVIAMLGDALAWQTAQENLSANEPEYGPRLGSYYQGVATDFTRIAHALEVARSAIELAGDDVGPSALARQLSRSSTPDADLIPLARDVAHRVERFAAETGALFSEKFLNPLVTFRWVLFTKALVRRLTTWLQRSPCGIACQK
jgi:hypothetical protein